MTLSPNCLCLIVIVTNYNPRLAIVGMVNTLNEQDFHLLNTIPLAGRTFIAYISLPQTCLKAQNALLFRAVFSMLLPLPLSPVATSELFRIFVWT